MKTLSMFAVLGLLAMPAQAKTVTFQVSGLTFDDGGTASGTFVLDTTDGTGGMIVSADLTTSGGSTLPGAHYVGNANDLFSGAGSGQFNYDGLYRFDFYSSDGAYALILYVHPPLSLDASNAILINQNDGTNTFECTQTGAFAARGDATGGSIAPFVSPTQQLQNLVSSPLLTSLPSNVSSQLDTKLNTALTAVNAHHPNSAVVAANNLQAFVNDVRAGVNSGKLSCTQAASLVAAAQSIVNALGQPPLAISLPCS